MPTKHGKTRFDLPQDDKFPPYVTVSCGELWFAVVMWHNPENGGFWEPWDTGVERFETKQKASFDAIALSAELGLWYEAAE